MTSRQGSRPTYKLPGAEREINGLVRSRHDGIHIVKKKKWRKLKRKTGGKKREPMKCASIITTWNIGESKLQGWEAGKILDKAGGEIDAIRSQQGGLIRQRVNFQVEGVNQT